MLMRPHTLITTRVLLQLHVLPRKADAVTFSTDRCTEAVAENDEDSTAAAATSSPVEAAMELFDETPPSSTVKLHARKV